jgi:hypothetical protein
VTPAERAEIVVTSRLLEASGKLDLLATGVALVSATALLFSTPHRVAALTAIALGIVAKFYAVRIAFDARLFADVALLTLTMSDLDAAFAKKAGRSWSERCRGARRLIVVFGLATVAQCAAIAFLVF